MAPPVTSHGTLMANSSRRKNLGRIFVSPVIHLLAKTGISPNALTLIGFLITVAGAVLIGYGHLFAGGWVMLGGSTFDMLDGNLARATGRITRFGGILDSILDRFSECAVMVGVAVYFAGEGSPFGVALTGAALTFSLLISYIRARAEGAGINCEVGILTRPERVIIMVLGLLLNSLPFALVAALAIITGLGLITAGQRLIYIRVKSKDSDTPVTS